MLGPGIAAAHIQHIGSAAMGVLSGNPSATLFSLTSRGIFLLFENQRMLFLSFEKYRGPLTLNAPGAKRPLSGLSRHETIAISAQGIHFADSGILISTDKAEAWHPAIPGAAPLHATERHARIRRLAWDVHQSKPEAGMSRLLPHLAGGKPADISLHLPFKDLNMPLDRIGEQLARREWTALSETLRSVLGLGSGLTPSGDDFIIGLLLSLNRWASVLLPGQELSTLNKNMVASAYRKTTTLSANLIECAALGLADERLIRASDYLAVGKSRPAVIRAGLLNWGSSSGVDALAGMITAHIFS